MAWDRGRGRVIVWWVGLVGSLAGGLAGAGCSGRGSGPVRDVGPVDRRDVGPVDRRDAAVEAGPGDGGLDAVVCRNYGRVRPMPWPPPGRDYDFCDQVFFKLPLDMWDQGSTGSVRLHGGRLVYYAWDASLSAAPSNIYYFDLEACRQYEVAWQYPQDASIALVWGNKLAAKWSLPCADSPNYFFLVDLDTWDLEQITTDATDVGSGAAAYNGRYLAADKAWELPDGGYRRLTRVVDLETAQEQVVAEQRRYPDYMWATDDYFAWIEFGDRGYGRWAVWYDPDAGEKHVIEETVEEYQEYVYAWGNKIVGHWGEIYQIGPYHVWVYDVATGDFQEVAIEQGIPFPEIWRNVLVMRTTKYAADPHTGYPVDIVLKDLETGVERRITREAGYVFLPGGFDPPWLVIGVYGGWPHHTYWMLNVYEAGLIDADGHVIPGDPVIDPPTPDD